MPQQSPWIFLLASLLLATSAPADASPAPGETERGLELYRDLPRDPLLVLGIWTEEPAVGFDGLVEFVTQFQGSAEIGEAIDLLNRLDYRLISSAQQLLLPHVGPEITLEVDLPPIDDLVAILQHATADATEGVLGRAGIVAGVKDREGLDRGLRELVEAIGGQIVEVEGVFRADLPAGLPDRSPTRAAPASGFVRIFYALHEDRLAVGFSREWVSAASGPRPEGERIVDGPDFARVFAHLDPVPTDLTYVNLPKILDYVTGSRVIHMVREASPEVRTFLDRFFNIETMSVGIGSTSVVTDGGVKTSHFGPPWMSGLASSSGLVAALAVPNLLAGVDRGKTRRTVTDIRAIATACEGFSVDAKSYPGPVDEWVPVDRIAGYLEPVYIGRLPRTDAWQNPILYWSDGGSYRIISTGRDGRMDRDWSGLSEPLTFVGVQGDIVFGDGRLLVAPLPLSE